MSTKVIDVKKDIKEGLMQLKPKTFFWAADHWLVNKSKRKPLRCYCT